MVKNYKIMIMNEYPKYILEINDRFNRQIDVFSPNKADDFVFSLGSPSAKLLAGGVANKPIKLYGSKLLKKMMKHGFDVKELRNLPLSVRDPIAVFDNYNSQTERAILIGLKTKNGNFLVSVKVGKGIDADFDIVTSSFGKKTGGIIKWVNKEMMTYVDKEKALVYLYLAAPIAAASDKEELNSAANIIKEFQNPKLPKENYDRITEISVNIDNCGQYSINCKVDGRQRLREILSGQDARKLARGEANKMEMAEKYYSHALSSKRSVGISMKR